LQVEMFNGTFRNVAMFDTSNYRILSSRLIDSTSGRNRHCELSYSNYQNTGEALFATVRKLSLTERSTVNIDLEFKQYAFNQTVAFPFSIPKNYKRL